jgi:hypothetical protein
MHLPTRSELDSLKDSGLSGWYWSSEEFGAGAAALAWYVSLPDGTQSHFVKDYFNLNVRCVRR